MKTNTYLVGRLAVALLAVSPLFAVAAPSATSPYVVDKTNSYVQDQSSKAMENLNGILCHVKAMDPSEMVNLGPYIALVDNNVCNPNDGGGNSGTTSTGASYKPAIVNSTRADTSSPMIAKVWLEDAGGPGGGKQSIFAYLSATQAPTATDPYGRFRLDFCGKQAATCSSMGFINSTASGLAFYSSDTNSWNSNTYTQVLQLQLNATSSTSGSGALKRVTTPAGSGDPDAAFYFAYNPDYFLRSDSTGAGGVCFSRDPLQAAESVWSYGLYDSNTGARIDRNSGFPIEYTDLATQTTMNGYVGYWGLNSPTTVDTSKPVNKVTYGGSGSPTKTPYTLLQTGGKLVKFTKVTKTLDDLDKVKFQFWPQATVTVTGGTLTSSTGGCSGYEVYWDKAAIPPGFKVTGQQDSTNNCNIKSFASAWTMSVANMQAAAPWGLNGWSQMLGGDFGINSTDMTNLPTTLGTTPVVMHLQNIVYPVEFGTAPLSSGLVCIENCPTKADIDASNANGALATTMPFVASSVPQNFSWNYGTGRTPYLYTLNATTGNLMDSAATPAAVVSTASQSSGTTGNYGNNNNGIQSGRLAIQADLDAQVTARGGNPANGYLPIDFDQLTTYYQWQTGGNSWNMLSMLFSNSTPVVFDPPLNVDFIVPSGAQYGTFAGATFTLQYGGFGNLWGIPSTCIDMSTNTPCVFNGTPTPQPLQRWTPQFSIPATIGGQPAAVTVNVAQGTVAQGTTYLVKALQKEVRLGKVAASLCTGLTLPTAGSVTLPDITSWSDPSSSSSATYVGTKPTFTTPPAPQVIQGVKMY